MRIAKLAIVGKRWWRALLIWPHRHPRCDLPTDVTRKIGGQAKKLAEAVQDAA
jgi:hypothetical protein